MLLMSAVMIVVAAKAQFMAGIRESHYVYGQYNPVNDIGIKVEHSLYSEKMGFQRIGLAVNYDKVLGCGFSLWTQLAGATTWNRNYQVASLNVTARYQYMALGINAAVEPTYDSGLHYTTCWKIGASVRITDAIDIRAAYTTIPEYRLSEKRIRAGFGFESGKLSVIPELSISAGDNTRFKNLRVLMSMGYKF